MGTDKLTKEDAVSVQAHEREWNEMFDGIHDVVDACAFQDGHSDYDEPVSYTHLDVYKRQKHSLWFYTPPASMLDTFF